MVSFIFLLCLTLSLTQSYVSASSETILLPLTHYLSTTQFNSTTHHLLKSSSTRSSTRHHQRQLSLPLSPGSDYTLSFSLGSHHPQLISLYMDTGSDLVWFPCSPFDCILCEGKYDPTTTFAPPNITTAKAINCMSPACSAAHSGTTSNLCAISHCPLESIELSECSSHSCPPFYYAYADGSFIARLYIDSLAVPFSTSSLLKNFTFGCAHTALGEPIGVAGFGRGVLSFPAQLAASNPRLGNQFSYCLVSHSFDSATIRHPSPLILGKQKRVEDNEEEYLYTEMLNNPKHPYFYSVGLLGISVGNRNIPAPAFLRRVDRKGNGGMVVDSGTTFTMLPASFYNAVIAEFEKRVGRFHPRASGVEEKTGLGPCYYYKKMIKVASLTLHFAGNKSSVVLPRRNYFYEFIDGGDEKKGKRNVGCMMLMNGGDDAEMGGGTGATLGNYQQQGFEVVYDLEKQRVGFARRKCGVLWKSLNQN